MIINALLLAALSRGPVPCSKPVCSLISAPTDTISACDTARCDLTAELLDQMARLMAELRRRPALFTTVAHDSTVFAHFTLHPGIVQGAPATELLKPQVAVVLDWGAVATRVPAVATAFTKVRLVPSHYLPILEAIANAEATDRLQMALQGLFETPAPPHDSTTLIWRNVAFLRTHRAEITALGLTLPELNIRPLSEYLAFLDSTAWAAHRVRLRSFPALEGDGFPIGFLDSIAAPKGTRNGTRSGPPFRVLFIGNSLTYYNSMPKIFGALAAHGLNRPVVVGLVSIPGVSSLTVWLATDVAQVIAAAPWDAIVVQLKPSTTMALTSITFQHTARVYSEAAYAQHARVVLWTQYPMPEGDAAFQTYLDSTTDAVARAVGAVVAPIPAAWEAIRQTNEQQWPALFYNLAADNTHPSSMGSYLMSLVLYQTLTGRSPIGLAHQVGAITLPDSVATLLQHAAAAR